MPVCGGLGPGELRCTVLGEKKGRAVLFTMVAGDADCLGTEVTGLLGALS